MAFTIKGTVFFLITAATLIGSSYSLSINCAYSVTKFAADCTKELISKHEHATISPTCCKRFISLAHKCLSIVQKNIDNEEVHELKSLCHDNSALYQPDLSLVGLPEEEQWVDLPEEVVNKEN